MYQDNRGSIAAVLFVVAAGALAYFGYKQFKRLEDSIAEKSKADSEPAAAKAEPVRERPTFDERSIKKAIADGLSVLGIGSEKPEPEAKAEPAAYDKKAVQKAISDGLKVIGISSNPVKSTPVKSKPKKVKKITGDGDFKSEFENPIRRYAMALENADREAGPFSTRIGTTPLINKTLSIINALPDNDFRQVIAAWKELRGNNNLLQTKIFQATKLDGAGRASLINRLFDLNIKA